jgi:hypothetical protein
MMPSTTVYLGLDPGTGGGLAMISPRRYRGDPGKPFLEMRSTPAPTTRGDLWKWIRAYAGDRYDVFAVIEKQTPRPTVWTDDTGVKSSVLKSTCLLYGSYERMCMALTAASIPYEEVNPQLWQSALHISPRKNGEVKSKWKSRLKAVAQQLFPRGGITLATADAVLLAEYGRRMRDGRTT